MGSSQPSVVAPPSPSENPSLSPYVAALALSSPVLSVNDEDTSSEDGSTLLSPPLASPAAPIFRCRFRTPLFGCVALDAVQREVRGRRELAERGALQAQGEGGRKQQAGKQTAAHDRRKPAQEGGKKEMNERRQRAEAAAEGEDAPRISHDLAMFVGGPIWAVDWCPLPRYSHTQYLAVACHPHLRPFSPLGVPLRGPALVQVRPQEPDPKPLNSEPSKRNGTSAIPLHPCFDSLSIPLPLFPSPFLSFHPPSSLSTPLPLFPSPFLSFHPPSSLSIALPLARHSCVYTVSHFPCSSRCPSPASFIPAGSYHVPLPQQHSTRWQGIGQQHQKQPGQQQKQQHSHMGHQSASLLQPAPHGPLLALQPVFQWKSNPAHGPTRLPCELAWKVDSAPSSPATPRSPHRATDLLAAGFQDGSVRNDPSRL
ncbi:unnamed protein product [Closterium sp. Naga37s-1]|nr:unnamed protein product [Closterium sp. Naga37s-1]